MTTIITPNMCSSCKHSLNEGKDFFCRRYPPITNMIPTPQGLVASTQYSRTQPSWTCGEFAKGVLT